jgi:hypothetical protein
LPLGLAAELLDNARVELARLAAGDPADKKHRKTRDEDPRHPRVFVCTRDDGRRDRPDIEQRPDHEGMRHRYGPGGVDVPTSVVLPS